MKNILFRDDNSLLGSNWYVLSKKLFIIPVILSFIGVFAIYSLIGTEYSILLIIKHVIFLIISLVLLIFYLYCQKLFKKIFKYNVYFFYFTFIIGSNFWIRD